MVFHPQNYNYNALSATSWLCGVKIYALNQYVSSAQNCKRSLLSAQIQTVLVISLIAAQTCHSASGVAADILVS